jgi:hypothetical protein
VIHASGHDKRPPPANIGGGTIIQVMTKTDGPIDITNPDSVDVLKKYFVNGPIEYTVANGIRGKSRGDPSKTYNYSDKTFSDATNPFDNWLLTHVDDRHSNAAGQKAAKEIMEAL